MNSSTENMMMYLVGFIVVLILAIAVPITISLLKKKKPLEVIAEEKIIPIVADTEATVSDALKKTEENFFGRIKNALTKNINDLKKVLDDIEEILYTSDLGPKTVERLLSKVSEDLSKSEMMDLSKIKSALESEMNLILSPVHETQKNSKSVIDLISKASTGPTVLMVVGVNGAGKTTSIGKITSQLASLNQKVLVAAGDTFRAAAGGQLKVWTDRANSHSGSEGLVEIFWPENTNDPAAVAFDAVTKAKAKNFDYVILDTAGRLHTQSNLMDELKKVKRVMTKVIDTAPHETWIVLDANSGQNALNQAVEFNKALELTGVVLTKMDGTAKGGVALGVVDQLQKPIKLIGIGEKISDLRIFNQTEYVESILGKS
jgi:fused signal recognition particle receptor